MKTNQDHPSMQLSRDETAEMMIDAMCKDRSLDTAFLLCCTVMMAALQRIDVDFGRARVMSTLDVSAELIEDGLFDRAPKTH